VTQPTGTRESMYPVRDAAQELRMSGNGTSAKNERAQPKSDSRPIADIRSSRDHFAV
jgi:hypothetical protein